MSDSSLIDIGVQTTPAPLGPNEAHDLSERLLAAGLPLDQVREQLKQRGCADPEIAISPAQAASWELDRLKADPIFAAKVNAGDPEANRLLSSLNARISMSKPWSPVPQAPTPNDYAGKFDLSRVDTALHERMQSETSSWAAALKLSPPVAAAIVEGVLDYTQRTNHLSIDQKENYGRNEEAQLKTLLSNHGKNADAVIAEAEAVLKAHSGRAQNIVAIARACGMQVAFELVSQARALAFAATRR